MDPRLPTLSPLGMGARRGLIGTGGAPVPGAAPAGGIGALPDGVGQPAPAGRGQMAPDAPAAARAGALNPSSMPPAGAFATLVAQQREAPYRGAVAKRSYDVKPVEGPLASLVREEDRVEHRRARRDISAIKTVAALVAAIARKPGSGVPDAIKSTHLANLLRAVNQAANRLSSFIAPTDAHRGWVQKAAADAATVIVARQWETDAEGEMRPVDAQLQAIEDVWQAADADPALAEVLDSLSGADYVEATTPEIARARVELSTRLAAWDLHSQVLHPLLGKGTYRFTYGRNAADIVARLMPEVYAIARDHPLRTESLDLRTTHTQGSVRRITELLGAEYVSRTRAVMNWIAEDGISDAEYQSRATRAAADFDTRIVPDLVAWARRNFLAVEAMAASLMEEQRHVAEHDVPRAAR